MPYTIGFGMRGPRAKVSTAEVATATEALKLVHDLEASDEEIKFIKAPNGHSMGKGELKMYADDEKKK